jgi:hypothetical protein
MEIVAEVVRIAPLVSLPILPEDDDPDIVTSGVERLKDKRVGQHPQ